MVMLSARLIYILGIIVSSCSIGIWGVIILAQLKVYKDRISTRRAILLAIAIESLYSNFIPIWYYIYRLSHNSNPSNIFYAFVMNYYLTQAINAVLYFIMYKY